MKGCRHPIIGPPVRLVRSWKRLAPATAPARWLSRSPPELPPWTLWPATPSRSRPRGRRLPVVRSHLRFGDPILPPADCRSGTTAEQDRSDRSARAIVPPMNVRCVHRQGRPSASPEVSRPLQRLLVVRRFNSHTCHACESSRFGVGGGRAGALRKRASSLDDLPPLRSWPPAPRSVRSPSLGSLIHASGRMTDSVGPRRCGRLRSSRPDWSDTVRATWSRSDREARSRRRSWGSAGCPPQPCSRDG
jgi:hypothetical protein